MNIIVNKRKKCKYPSLHIQQSNPWVSLKCFIPTFWSTGTTIWLLPCRFGVTLAWKKWLMVHSSLWRCQRSRHYFPETFFFNQVVASLNKQTSKQNNLNNSTVIHNVNLPVHCILYTCYFTDQSFCLTSTMSPTVSSQLSCILHTFTAHFISLLMLCF